MRFENTSVYNIYNAALGARNPMNSWNRSDSVFKGYNGKIENTEIGKNDLELMQRLIKAGSEHRKFLRQIFISVDVTAPSYFMAELDTYKISTVRNSTSMQHKGTSHRYTIDDFEVDEQIKEVLREKAKEYSDLFYPYESNEYKVYTCENGRQYEVYKNGKVFALPFSYTDTKGRNRSFEKREVTPSKMKAGYFEIHIGGRNGEKWLLHRLVAYIWLDNPNNYTTVDHLDGNKANNSVENLEWVSLEENVKREWEKGLVEIDLQKAYKNWKASSKIMPDIKLKIQKLYQEGKSQKELAEIFDISSGQISVIVRNAKNTSDNQELFEHCWYWEKLIENLNVLRDKYLETKDYKYFKLIRQLMPMGYLYTSTITMNYENILSMYQQRCVHPHKLSEWSVLFKEWVESLPYAKELLCISLGKK